MYNDELFHGHEYHGRDKVKYKIMIPVSKIFKLFKRKKYADKNNQGNASRRRDK